MRVDPRSPVLSARGLSCAARCLHARREPGRSSARSSGIAIAVTAELAEPVLSWAVAEGDRVEAGTVLLEHDARRQDARIAEAHSQLDDERSAARRAHARRDASRRSTRRARISRGRAPLRQTPRPSTRAWPSCASASSSRTSLVDQALAARNQRRAETQGAEAQLRELTQGTRPEQVEQAAAAVAAATASLDTLQLTRERLTVRAPRAGRVDALPFHAGDQPPVGAELVSLLVGDAPYARVFVPAPRRAELMKSAHASRSASRAAAAPLTATLRSIRSEPSFTPYYALAGDDATPARLPAPSCCSRAATRVCPPGLPLTAVPLREPRPAMSATPNGAPAIHARGLTKRFGHVAAVDGLDLTVRRARGLRLPRAERLGQVDDDPHALRPAEPDRRRDRRARLPASRATPRR